MTHVAFAAPVLRGSDLVPRTLEVRTFAAKIVAGQHQFNSHPTVLGTAAGVAPAGPQPPTVDENAIDHIHGDQASRVVKTSDGATHIIHDSRPVPDADGTTVHIATSHSTSPEGYQQVFQHEFTTDATGLQKGHKITHHGTYDLNGAFTPSVGSLPVLTAHL
ncbi:hypothetical protein K439DRAFT_1624081 [Ramaria rubella]|nr:hypothetical protein K439DRAFT_1624081 [Ramaria rubella]